MRTRLVGRRRRESPRSLWAIRAVIRNIKDTRLVVHAICRVPALYSRDILRTPGYASLSRRCTLVWQSSLHIYFCIAAIRTADGGARVLEMPYNCHEVSTNGLHNRFSPRSSSWIPRLRPAVLIDSVLRNIIDVLWFCLFLKPLPNNKMSELGSRHTANP